MKPKKKEERKKSFFKGKVQFMNYLIKLATFIIYQMIKEIKEHSF